MKFFVLLSFIFLATNVRGTLVPSSVVQQNLKDYGQEDKQLIEEDLKNIDKLVFRGSAKGPKPLYLGTAGGPGACKSTVLETILHEDPTFSNMAYIDPDPQSLRLMINTYLTKGLSFYAISKAESFQKAQVDAYNYWRGGSNYIAQTLLNKAFENRFDIAHGTTATSPIMGDFYKSLKGRGYTLHLVLCYAPHEVRGRAIEYRTKTQANYQATPEDAIQKGKMFCERFSIYFKYADALRLYWTDDCRKGSLEVARIENNTLIIKDPEGYEKFVGQYEKDRSCSSEKLPSWESLLSLQGISVLEKAA